MTFYINNPKCEINYTGNLEWLEANTIFLTVHGSHAMGLATETSDVDIRGIAIPPKEYYFGNINRFEQAEFKDEANNSEGVIYEIRKFVKLATEANPSILELLFVDDSDIIICKDAGKKLIEMRDLFITKKVKHTFSGYAHQQLKRIKTHDRWIKLGHTIKKPERKTYKLPNRTLIPANQLAAAKAAINKKLDQWNLKELGDLEPATKISLMDFISDWMADVTTSLDENLWKGAARTLGFSDNFIELLDKERQYENAKKEYDSYMHWKATRNPARALLEEKFGYDTKHASHVVRLYREGCDILATGKLVVKRHDRDDILAIRNGAWTLEQLLEFVASKDAELKMLYETSKLPNEPDRKKIDQLLISIVESKIAI